MNASDYFNRAVAKWYKGDNDGARRDLDEAIHLGLDPAGSAACLFRGLLKIAEGDPEGAIGDFDEAIRIGVNPGYYAYFWRGYAKSRLQDFGGAIRDFDEAIRLEPANVRAYFFRASARHDQQDFSGAIRDYDEGLRLNPGDVWGYNNRGCAKLCIADYEGAMQDYNEAVRLDADHINALFNKAFLLGTCPVEKYRNPKEALKTAEAALRANPSFSYAKSAKACALALMGDFLTAIQLQTDALEDPKYRQDENIDGGASAAVRIEAWERRQQWFLKPPSQAN